jgi:hypothetical protein
MYAANPRWAAQRIRAARRALAARSSDDRFSAAALPAFEAISRLRFSVRAWARACPPRRAMISRTSAMILLSRSRSVSANPLILTCQQVSIGAPGKFSKRSRRRSCDFLLERGVPYAVCSGRDEPIAQLEAWGAVKKQRAVA